MIKLEEQKSDLERQLKTLTKQIKVRCGYSRGWASFYWMCPPLRFGDL